MLPRVYPLLQHGTIDELYKALERCEYVINKHETEDPHGYFAGYSRTAKIYIPLIEAEIIVHRNAGEITMGEILFSITGNSFKLMQPTRC